MGRSWKALGHGHVLRSTLLEPTEVWAVQSTRLRFHVALHEITVTEVTVSFFLLPFLSLEAVTSHLTMVTRAEKRVLGRCRPCANLPQSAHTHLEGTATTHPGYRHTRRLPGYKPVRHVPVWKHQNTEKAE